MAGGTRRRFAGRREPARSGSDAVRPLAAAVSLAVVVLGSAPVGAQATAEAPLDLEGCIAEALQSNPRVLQWRSEHRAALARVNAARDFPQPTVAYDSDLQPNLLNFRDSGESYLGLVQAIEFPGKRGVRGRIAATEADQTFADLEAVRLDLAYEVAGAFYGLLLARERLRLANEDASLSGEFLAQTRHKHETGDVGQVEVLRAEVESARAEGVVRRAASEVDLAGARLGYLLGRPPDRPLSIRGALESPPLPPREDLGALQEAALSKRPELRRLSLAVARARLLRSQAKKSYLPDLEVGVARHRISGEPTTWDVTLALPVPLFFWQPKRGEIAAASASLTAAEQEAEHVRRKVRLEVEEAWRQMETARDQIRRFETGILGKAQESYGMFAFAYAEGEIEGLELIAARRTLLETRQAYAEALYEAGVATAALRRAVGG
jgi:cobalt-zinc-cadmium efflux system outer membrane protein